MFLQMLARFLSERKCTKTENKSCDTRKKPHSLKHGKQKQHEARSPLLQHCHESRRARECNEW